MMRDDYSLTLLAEMGVDVYLPRTAEPSAPAETRAVEMEAAPIAVLAKPLSGPAGAVPAYERDLVANTAAALDEGTAQIVILHAQADASRVLVDIERSVRTMGLSVALGASADLAAGAQVRALVVLGEVLARELGAALPAQRQRAIEWIVAAEPAVLAGSAGAKRALWGEFKRIARVLAAAARK